MTEGFVIVSAIGGGGGMVSSTKPRSGEGSPLDAAVSKYCWSFCAVKTPRYKNGMEAIFIPGGACVP